MLLVPLQPIASQAFQITLAGQACNIAVYVKTDPSGNQYTYLDLQLNNVSIRSCQLCQNRTRLVRFAYLGFVGDLVFVDMQGQEDPQWSGLGQRWQLVYLAPGEYEADE